MILGVLLLRLLQLAVVVQVRRFLALTQVQELLIQGVEAVVHLTVPAHKETAVQAVQASLYLKYLTMSGQHSQAA